MPLRVRNWNDSLQRLLYQLDRDLDKYVRDICPPEASYYVPRTHGVQTAVPIKRQHKSYIPYEPSPSPVATKVENEIIRAGKNCCSAPRLIYVDLGHQFTCPNCGACESAGFEEVGTSVQFELREHSSTLIGPTQPYDRNKHFKKILRDVTNMHIRVPKHLIRSMRRDLKSPDVGAVRRYLRKKKLYHYYTSSNNIARVLGDDTTRIKLDSHAFNKMVTEADVLSNGFERMRKDGLIKRKNFVNANVLILHIATRQFRLPQIGKHLRLPRPKTQAAHEHILNDIESYLGR